MSRKAYITIDDSPSPHTDDLTDYLAAHDIPAILFCRGDFLEQNPEAVVRAVEKEMTIANHNYSHQPAGSLAYEEIVAEIEKTEALIDAAYHKAGKARPGKYFRFPYLDKGDGDRLERRFDDIIACTEKGEAMELSKEEKVQKVQDYLKKEGFTQPFTGVTHPLYRNAPVAKAADCLFTYSSCDWMLTMRHKGQWAYKSLDDLKRKMDNDPWLCKEDGTQITLFHDQPEIENIVTALLSYMIEKKFMFLCPA